MNDVTLTIKFEAPDLVAAIMRLVAAISPAPNILTQNVPPPQMPASNAAPTAPFAVPQPPVAAPVTPAAPVVPVSPVPTAASAPPVGAPVAPPAPAPAAPAVPVAGAPTYTLGQISRAGTALVDAGKMESLLGLLSRYGIQAITQLAPEQYGAFATELRALGAQI